MSLKIISADERMKKRHSVSGVIFGPHGIGKTFLLKSLDPSTTLFVNMESGDLCVKDWPVDSIEVKTWEEARDIACLVAGPNLANRSDQPYSQAHYDYCLQEYEGVDLAKYQTFFYDSISVLSRLCFQWSNGQPAAFSKAGTYDQRGAYGLLGQELMRWFCQVQKTKEKHTWLVGGLDEKFDDFNRSVWTPQIEGSKAANELPGIFDQVISMVQLKNDDGEPYRAFVCHKINPWGYPAKDRSTKLEMIEPPHLGKLIHKISGDYSYPESNDFQQS